MYLKSLMTEPSEILREEHRVIEHLLEVLRGVSVAVDRGEAVAKEDLDTALDVLVNFADKCHHAKEERALFPVLARQSPTEGALLAHRLEGDHRAARKLLTALRDLTPAVADGDRSAREMFAKSARTYASLLEEHITQETHRLLPLIDAAIPLEKRTKLAKEFDRIEREETGEGMHAKYEHTIRALAAKYAHATPHAH